MKTQLFALENGAPTQSLAHGLVERPAGVGTSSEPSADDLALIERALADAEAKADGRAIVGAGHRIVHGGRTFTGPARVDAQTLAAMEALCDLAPLHQPHNLMAARALQRLRPKLPQVASFDTAFHRTQPIEARRMPLPDWAFEEGIERYGFHGLSYAWLVEALRAKDALPRRLLAFHLGAGASACAILEGRSVDTSMGFSTLDGLMMATRPGGLDPGVLIHLLRTKRLSLDELETTLYRDSGLAAVGGAGGDMRALLASDAPNARLAVALYCRRAAVVGAGLVAAMGGLDGIVFTGGVGEHAAPIRSGIAGWLGHLGVALDAAANAAGEAEIGAAGAAVRVHVVAADEERIIAREAAAILRVAA